MNYNQAFEAALSRLNEGQRLAVETTEGPVLVLAGPGTGKTQVLSARIGYILREGLAQSGNILCLTFTESGVTAMRNRLVSFIGSEGLKVNINTFHGFCNSILKENPERFDTENMELITSIEEKQFISQLLGDVEIGTPLRPELKLSDTYFKQVRSIFNEMQKEHWAPEFVIGKCDEYVAHELATNEKYIYKQNRGNNKKGDLKPSEVKKLKDPVEKIKQTASLFPTYLQILKDNRRYTYYHMISWVLEAFEQDQDFLLDYQERYQYILVDEYQDTNGSQNELLFKLTTLWAEQANIFVVGDDDQAIYGFQGANVGNILDFYERYRQTIRVIPLTNNYRSSQAIIDNATDLINRNTNRIVNQVANVQKSILAANDKVRLLNIEPELKVYQNPFEEAIGVAGMIRGLLDKGAEPSEIAVLYRKNKQDVLIKKVLEQEKISFQTSNQINILEQPVIRNLIKILAYVYQEAQGIHNAGTLFEVLHNPCFGLAPHSITRTFYAAGEKYRYELNLRMYILDNFTKDDPECSVSEELYTAMTHLEKCIRLAHTEPVYPVLGQIIHQCGIVSSSSLSENKILELQCLDSLLNYVSAESTKNKNFTVETLLEHLEVLDSLNEGINLTFWQGDSQAVRLMTLHRSKGLEFDHVIMIGNDEKAWEGSAAGQWKIPENLYLSEKSSEIMGRTETIDFGSEEGRRLFYVGMTRAKKSIHFTYSLKNDKLKDQKIVPFIAEVFNDVSSDDLIVHFDAQYLQDKHIARLIADTLPVVDLHYDDFFDAFIEDFRLSATAFSDFIRCPLEFYYNHVLKIPKENKGSMLYGTALHSTLQAFFHRLKAGGLSRDDYAGVLVSLFKERMERQYARFIRKEYDYFQDRGQRILPRYAEVIPGWYLNAEVEKPLNDILIQGVPVKGFLDKLENHPAYKVVVDYKSGEFRSEKLTGLRSGDLAKASPYWIQGAFYTLMLKNHPTENIREVRIRFEFVEEDIENMLKEIVYLDEELSIISDAIAETYNSIRAGDFNTGCGRENCHWCNFVKNNFDSDHLEMALKQADVILPEEDQ